jgi:hypothetical protein
VRKGFAQSIPGNCQTSFRYADVFEAFENHMVSAHFAGSSSAYPEFFPVTPFTDPNLLGGPITS